MHGICSTTHCPSSPAQPSRPWTHTKPQPPSNGRLALTAFSSGWISVKDSRDASSMQTCTYSQPIPRLLDWPVRSPVMRWPVRSNLPQALDIKVDHVAGMVALIAAHGLGRLQIAKPRKTRAAQNPADGGRRNPGLCGDMRPCQAFTAQGVMIRSATSSGVGLRRERGRELRSCNPARRPLVHTVATTWQRSSRNSRRSAARLRKGHPTCDHPNKPLSTQRRQSGILDARSFDPSEKC